LDFQKSKLYQAYSPQSGASFGEFSFSDPRNLIFYYFYSPRGLGFLLQERMATSMRVEDGLEGSRNVISWKNRLQIILNENDLLEHVTIGVPEPYEAKKKTKHKKNEKKEKIIVSNSVKDHFIPHISEL
jgi:hypothetical protein